MSLRMLLTALCLALACVSALAAPIAPDLTVELHTHLFMKEGLAWTFRGDFDGPLRATSWEDRFSAQANAETLDRSRIGILVLALYANPAVGVEPRAAIRAELARAETFVATHPNWMIARTPDEARIALAGGKRVIVLSLEGASKILDTDGDLEEFIDRRGIRIVTPLHLSDDRYGGVALLDGYQKLASPLTVLKGLFGSDHDEQGCDINARGLSAQGSVLVEKLLQHHVWIDLAHASDHAQETLIPLLKKYNQPLLYTHTTLRRHRHAERSISDAQLAEVRKTGGIIGVVPSEDVIGTVKASACPKGCSRASCEGSVTALAHHYSEIASEIGADATMLGTDYNGGMRHLRPSCGSGTSIDQSGLWNIGQAAELWTALERAGASVPHPLSRMVDRFLDTWTRAYSNAR